MECKTDVHMQSHASQSQNSTVQIRFHTIIYHFKDKKLFLNEITIVPDKSGIHIFLISPRNVFWVLIRSALLRGF